MQPFPRYVKRLRQDDLKACSRLAAGFVMNNDPNGAYSISPYGAVVTLSLAKKFFLYFMNLAYLDAEIDVPVSVRTAAHTIGIRTMLKTEAMDFDVDPRGIIPFKADRVLRQATQDQLEFIIGHEYAHHLCGHLKTASTIDRPMFACFAHELVESPSERVFNLNEQQEFEADDSALDRIRHDNNAYERLVFGAVTWLLYLDVYQAVSDQLFPTPPWKLRTHPLPIERLARIRENHASKAGLSGEMIDEMAKHTSFYKAGLSEDLAINVEKYEKYGSVYLDKPNTPWRGPELRDRVDY